MDEPIAWTSPCRLRRDTSPVSVAVRLEGGLGDHILGMRVLSHVRQRFPLCEIVAYSDCCGHNTPLTVVGMSPLVSRVVAVRQRAAPATLDDIGAFENICDDDLALMHSADLLIDTHGPTMLTSASIALNVPVFELLDNRPELVVPQSGQMDADRLLTPYGDALFVGINFAKYGPQVFRRYESRIRQLLHRLLECPRVIILNIFTSCYDQPHWPEPGRTLRLQGSLEESQFHRDLAGVSERIVSCVDLPISVVAGLLTRCRYFVGVDNGIKHLAWALGVPHRFFYGSKPPLTYALRWMPDLNRMLLYDCPEASLDSLVTEIAGCAASRNTS